MNLSNIKFMLLGVVFLCLGACSNGSSGGGVKDGGTVNPELQKPALETVKETLSCTGEEAQLVQENGGEIYYQFTKTSSQATRIVRSYENGVRTHETDSVQEISFCLSYQDHCNQTWDKETVKLVSTSVVRVTTPSANLRRESMETKGTWTLLSTDYADRKVKVNKPESRQYSNSTLERVDGNKRYLVEGTSQGETQKYNESAVTEINTNGSSRTENFYVLKPVKFSDSEETWTILKGSDSCTIQSEKVQN